MSDGASPPFRGSDRQELALLNFLRSPAHPELANVANAILEHGEPATSSLENDVTSGWDNPKYSLIAQDSSVASFGEVCLDP